MNTTPIVVLALAWYNPATAEVADVRFNRDIRPILAQNCLACHGVDNQKRKAGLRLDISESALAERDGGFAIKPGDLAQSALWQRINSADPDQVMPPPQTKKHLTAEQKETMRQWIEQGARYEKHWAFETPVRPTVPSVKQTGWARNAVDQFILARLEQEGLSPMPEADRATLARRVAFALTGLPPSLRELADYESDPSPKAYENLVDRYLQSPRFGEEMARHWLDVARYADTHGLHLDNERNMWAYRDWVIKAFNDNLPFDKFTIEQLAGDLLPNPTPDQLVATGFNRCNVTTSEGGAIDAEFLYRYAVDRTSTMIQAWMGLTGGCAVCHEHKYDPLSMREFYSLYSMFYSAADPAMDRNINITEPFYKLPTPEQKAALAEAPARETESRRQLEELAGRIEYVDPATQQPAPDRQSVEDVWLDDLFPAGSHASCSSRNASIWATDEVDPPLGHRALRQACAANYHDKFENPTQPLVIPENPTLSVSVRVDLHEPARTLKLEVVSGRHTRHVLWGDPENYKGSKTDANWLGEIPEPNRWVRLEVPAAKLGLEPGDSVRSITLAQFGGIAWWDGLTVSGEVNPATDPRSSFSVWWKDRTGKDTPGVPGELAGVLKDGPDKQPAQELRDKLLRYYIAYIARPASAELAQRYRDWLDAQSARAAIEESIVGTFVFKEVEKPREAFVMLRGQYNKPGEPVEPGVPTVFPALKKSTPESRATRLDLANWLVAPEHPLTARVAVNRVWQQIFGTGLVKTSYDFGSQGEPPSHPDLLDWLAVWYRENGWDTKALVRLLVESATFRQQSRVSPELRARDPENRLYARGPRIRLDAEQVRDNALFTSGLINFEMGGPGVKPYQPPNIWEPVGYSDSNTRFYLQDHGPALYRRSVYCFLKRTAPPPFMSNFDAPNREQYCARRERSNTPLQALQLMNDTQHFEAARVLGERMLTEGGSTPDERIAFLYRVVLARLPRPEELKIVRQTLEDYLARFRADTGEAAQLIDVGESTPRIETANAELAAYALVANLVLNLDETVTRN